MIPALDTRYVNPTTGEIRFNPFAVPSLKYDPAVVAASVIHEAHKAEHRAEVASLGEPGEAMHGYIVIRQSCGKRRVVPELCSDPLCKSCERKKAQMRRRRWLPIVQGMRDARMLTLTTPDTLDLQEGLDFHHASFRRLLSMRLGSRNLTKLEAEALDFANQHYGSLVEAGKMDAVAAQNKLAFWQQAIARFISSVEKRKAKQGHWPEMRHMVGRGFASLEVTFSEDWHVHRHLCVDGAFIPWPILCAAWRRATRSKGQIVDIRKIDQTPEGMREVVKYLTKPWEIPQPQQTEFRAALRGIKKIWPLGKAKPQKPESVCPYCGSSACKARPDGLANLVEAGSRYGREYRIFRMDALSDRYQSYFVMLRDPDGKWREAPLLDTLSVCAAVDAAISPGPGSLGTPSSN